LLCGGIVSTNILPLRGKQSVNFNAGLLEQGIQGKVFLEIVKENWIFDLMEIFRLFNPETGDCFPIIRYFPFLLIIIGLLCIIIIYFGKHRNIS